MWIQKQTQYYRNFFEIISNVTIVEPGDWIEHEFKNDCYQKVVKDIIEKYRNDQNQSLKG